MRATPCMTETLFALDTYFVPRANPLHSTIMFSNRVQRPEESNEQFIRNLHELSVKCGWDDEVRQNMLKTKLLAGMSDKHLSRELQLNENVTLDEVRQRMRTKELIANNQKLELDGIEGAVAALSVRSSGHRRGSDRTDSKSRDSSRLQTEQNCKFCGYMHPPRRCPVYGKICRACNRKNHFQKMCLASRSAV